jgi:hypothetical protein
MIYVIMSFIGDYPIEHQPFWNEEYDRKESAIRDAKTQHNILIQSYPSLYTLIIEKDNDEVVEWLKHGNLEIRDKVKATKLADELFEGVLNGTDCNAK